MKKLTFWGLSVFALSLFACKSEENENLDLSLNNALSSASDGKGITSFQLPFDYEYEKIPQDPKNPITFAKIQLGKLLFHETALGGSPKHVSGKFCYSCASCHHVEGGFGAGLAQGIGDGGEGFGKFGEGRKPSGMYALTNIDVQPLRTPSALNSAFQTNLLWNGQFGATGVNVGTQSAWTAGTPKEKNNLGFEGVETQAIAGQDVHRLLVDTAYLRSRPEYYLLFSQAFGNLPDNQRISSVTVGLAIAAYERQLLANKAPFQEWLRGKTSAMSDEEKRGAILFFTKGNCGKCHNGPALNSMTFHAYGMGDLKTGQYGAVNVGTEVADHKGRGGFTGKAEDMYKFKVPQLYNLKDARFYGHGATFTSIEEVVRYKNRGIKENVKVADNQLSSDFKPLGLSEEEVRQIALFIENSLYDANLKRYKPYGLPSGFCFPNNDPKSRVDRGCD